MYGHQDGYKKQKPCPGRQRAIQSGVVLPPTWKELNEPVQVSMNSGNTLKSFLSQSTFSVKLFNVVLVIWILRHALPWIWFQDTTLRAAFKLSNPAGVVRLPKRAASTAKELFFFLYTMLLSAASRWEYSLFFVSFFVLNLIDIIDLSLTIYTPSLNPLQNNPSMFSLAHDGWTTKGNRMAFIGVMINYIDDHWNYQTVHLTLKWVTWHHCGDLLARPVAQNLIRHAYIRRWLVLKHHIKTWSI